MQAGEHALERTRFTRRSARALGGASGASWALGVIALLPQFSRKVTTE